MSRIKVATVGCGYFSKFHHHAWKRLGVKLVGVCDYDQSKADAFCVEFGADKAYSDFSEMLDQTQPDIVDIILPSHQHLSHIKAACLNSRVVICQKPFTDNLDQAHEAAEFAAKHGTKLVIHENFRFQPWYRKIKQLIDNNILGQLYQIRFNLRPGDGRGIDVYLDRQPYFRKMSRFLIRETGIHFVDLFRYLCGEPTAVWADLWQLNPVIKGEDCGIFVLQFDSHLRAVFDGNRLSDHSAFNHRLTMGELFIEAEKGTLTLNGYGEIWFRQKGKTRPQLIQYAWQDIGFGGDCVYYTQKSVLDHLQTGVSLENTAEQYLINLEIEELIYMSNQSGTRIAM